MNGVNITDFDEERPARDFRRNNGSPMVRRLGDPSKWERYSRPSGFGHDLDDESALTLWRIDRAMDGVARSAALAARIAVHSGKEGRKELRDEAIKLGRGDEASDLGRALHTMTERVEQEPDFEVPELYAGDIAAYLAAMDSAGLESTHIEVHLCNDELRAAGTADRVLRARRELSLPDGSRLAPGTQIIGDLKTGSRLDYSLPGYVIQLAIYAGGVPYDVDRNERLEPFENLNTRWGVLMHLPVGESRCDLLWCDLEIGRHGAEVVRQVRKWRKRNNFGNAFVFPEDDVAALLATELGAVELVAAEEAHENWVEAMTPFCQQRIVAIGNHPEARALLLRKWPASVPPLKVGGHQPGQISLILDLLDAVEAAFSLPFPPNDPRVEWNEGKHRDDVSRSNQATKEQQP